MVIADWHSVDHEPEGTRRKTSELEAKRGGSEVSPQALGSELILRKEQPLVPRPVGFRAMAGDV